MLLLTRSICAILLALSFLLDRAHGWFFHGRELIGYRAVTEDQARFINDGNKLSTEEIYDKPGESLNQIGEGFYLYNDPSCGNEKPSENNWFCAIEADKEKMAKATKVWIQEFWTRWASDDESVELDLWAGDESLVKQYIRWELRRSPVRALRFSWIILNGWKPQMVIPNDTIRRNALQIWAQCYRTKEELYRYSSEIINWEAKWEINGEAGLPSVGSFSMVPDTFDPMVS
ncbi:hypothetical protein MBM_06553 [Drepanopeziza brunnea f. sp. 'multigermtubi' MB_m1]|uniref:Uncharacterized protein n=1 Tax=Marssonina brunnea f. sp. multigermtubi (strain MB_m1) TaxID=1072389 RepID=K1WSG3_MARBU|nr:uncharacterized protein MBM_06553 [Drepanopeziza brunnea f. sp. 'multigermtubi' MB_m1]EKD15337.1 hypothetical protein MBM_06553 [Drepanopeziza brunnea f. sp. 'multigermtubi' MB_m1]